MDFINGFKDKIFLANSENFNEIALKIYKYQSEMNPVYSKYQDLLKIDHQDVRNILEIPFLPIEFFKTYRVISGNKKNVQIFMSSGTTQSRPSRHYIPDVGIYKTASLKAFELFFGEADQYTFLALLPSYLERNESSLVFMVNEFMKLSNKPCNGFYMNDYESLLKTLDLLIKKGEKVILFGVSFALLEFAEKYQPDLNNIIVIETGGMKGRREEIPRDELHLILKDKLNKKEICSEYGMTELLSQAYSLNDGVFTTPPWMKIFTRDISDPFRLLPVGEQGALNIIDLANIYSCSFLATSDLGRLISPEKFEVLGRVDNSEIRGCNLLAGL